MKPLTNMERAERDHLRRKHDHAEASGTEILRLRELDRRAEGELQGEQSQQPTPGPWLAKEGEVYSEQSGKTVARCDIGGRDAEGDANARLIAVAPELLAALEAFLRAPSPGSNGNGSITIEVQTFNLNAARSAIRKAKEGA